MMGGGPKGLERRREPKGGGVERWEAQHFAPFLLLPPQISFFLPSLRGPFSWNWWAPFKAPNCGNGKGDEKKTKSPYGKLAVALQQKKNARRTQ